MTDPSTSATAAAPAHLKLLFRAVGGQMLHFVVRQLVTRLGGVTRSMNVEEVHGMAQRGGSVSASLDLELMPEYRPPFARVLLGLERLEGARGLSDLRPGDAAFIARAVRLPPGRVAGAAAAVPTEGELLAEAKRLEIDLTNVDAAYDSPWAVVEAAFARGAIPRPPRAAGARR